MVTTFGSIGHPNIFENYSQEVLKIVMISNIFPLKDS
jgi:hypothetical protein